MKKIIIVLSMLISSVAIAQKPNIVNASLSLKSAQKSSGDDVKVFLAEAKDYIDLAFSNESTSNAPKMWMYRYQVYLEIAQKHPEIDNKAIVKATESIIKCLQKGKKDKIIIKRWRTKEDVLSDLNVCAGILFNEAGKSYENKNYSYAIELYNKIFDLMPYDEEDLLKRRNITKETIYLNCFYSSKQMEDSKIMKQYLQKLIDLNYNDPLIFSEMTKILLSENDTLNAINYMNQGRDFFEDDQGLINEEINLYINLNRTDELISKLTSALENDPENETILNIRGTIYYNLGEYEKSKIDYQNILKFNPNSFDANFVLGSIEVNFANILLDKSNNTSNDKLYTKWRADADKLFIKALPLLEKAFSIDAKNKENINLLKQIYYKIGNYKKSDEMKKLISEL